jgi:uncharacterized protein YndB with AHSA1/START domain
MKNLEVRSSVWIETSREQVWQALTIPERLMSWLVPNLPGLPMVHGDDGRLTIQMGAMGIDLMRLEDLEPPRRLVAHAVPDELVAVTCTLEEERGGTRVNVIVSGFELLPEEAREDRLERCRAGWEESLGNLKACVECTALPFPQAHVAPLFGYWRKIRQTFAVERSIWIGASPERVWRAVTDPVQMEGWFSPGTPWQLTALEVGGRLFSPDATTGAELYTQTIEHLEPLHRLVLGTQPDASGKSEKTAYTLQAEGMGTRLTVTNTGYEQMGEARWGAMEQNTFGFGMMLQNLKAYVEGRDLPVIGGF